MQQLGLDGQEYGEDKGKARTIDHACA